MDKSASIHNLGSSINLTATENVGQNHLPYSPSVFQFA